MKFLVTWTARSGGSAAESEADTKRGMQMFSKWSPPAGSTIHEFLARLDGRGGYSVVETDDPAALAEAPAKFGVFDDFEIIPVMDIADSIPIAQEGIEFRESIT
jgi:hypothetical protein